MGSAAASVIPPMDVSKVAAALSQLSLGADETSSSFLSVPSESPLAIRSGSFQRRLDQCYKVERMAEILARELDAATFVDPYLPFKLFPAGHAYKYKITHSLRDSLTKDNIPSYLKPFFEKALDDPVRSVTNDELSRYDQYDPLVSAENLFDDDEESDAGDDNEDEESGDDGDHSSDEDFVPKGFGLRSLKKSKYDDETEFAHWFSHLITSFNIHANKHATSTAVGNDTEIEESVEDSIEDSMEDSMEESMEDLLESESEDEVDDFGDKKMKKREKVIRSTREWVDYFRAVPMKGKTREKRKPDVVLADMAATKLNDGDWSRVLVVCEISRRGGFSARMRRNNAQRAALMFLNCAGRRFAIIVSISGQQFMISVYHRSGVTHSSKYDIVDHFGLFLHIFSGLIYCKIEYLGNDPEIKISGYKPTSITHGGRTYNILGTIYNKEGIVGRGTVCFLVQDSETLEEFMLKISWVNADREKKNELYYYDLIKLKKIMGVPIVIKHWDGLWLDGVDSTSYWRPDSEDRFISRTLRKILFQGVAKPIYEFSSLFELLSAIEDILLILIELRKEVGILHRDISLYNIMLIRRYPEYQIESESAATEPPKSHVSPNKSEITASTSKASSTEKRGGNAKSASGPPSTSAPSPADAPIASVYKGFLIDMEYAAKADDLETKKISSAEETKRRTRTGTLPFMAIQLLLGYKADTGSIPVHTMQFEVESILYILIWMAIHYTGPNGQERNFKKEKTPVSYGGSTRVPTDLWMLPGASFVELGLHKFSTLVHMEGIIFPWIHPYFNGLKEFLKAFADALFVPRVDPNYDRRVMSDTDPAVFLKLVREYKVKIKEPSISDPDYKAMLDDLLLPDAPKPVRKRQARAPSKAKAKANPKANANPKAKSKPKVNPKSNPNTKSKKTGNTK